MMSNPSPTPKHAGHAPDVDNIPTLESLGIELHPETLKYVENPTMLANAIGGNG